MRALFVACIALAMPLSAHAAGDPVRGKTQFAVCGACHTVEKGGPNKVGPNLNGVVGRKAGEGANFAYSEALKKSGVVWDDKNLLAWIKKPAALIQGTKMPFAGYPSDETCENVLAYLKEATK